jgi:hypothetical protein
MRAPVDRKADPIRIEVYIPVPRILASTPAASIAQLSIATKRRHLRDR